MQFTYPPHLPRAPSPYPIGLPYFWRETGPPPIHDLTGPRPVIFLAGKRNTSGERYTSGRQDLLQASSRSNMTRNVTSTSNVAIKNGS
jgi:hypothetical protein